MHAYNICKDRHYLTVVVGNGMRCNILNLIPVYSQYNKPNLIKLTSKGSPYIHSPDQYRQI